MKKFGSFLFLLLLLFGQTAYANVNLISLSLQGAFFVEGPEHSQPSGLTIWNGKLYSISDRHDHTIFEIVLTPDTALMQPYLDIAVPDTLGAGSLDFEGITCDKQGNFYLVSEKQFRILRVDANGEDAAWITPSLQPYGEAAGLFKTFNAFLEGIAMNAPGKFLLCAEREPRGFITVNAVTTPIQINAYPLDKTVFAFGRNRSLDFSGLFYDRDSFYVLERNAYVICRLTVNGDRFEEGPGWSYEEIVTRPEYRYTDMRYGKAEGLCMDEKYVYVILDNNEIPRESDVKDNRPLLLILKRPGN